MGKGHDDFLGIRVKINGKPSKHESHNHDCQREAKRPNVASESLGKGTEEPMQRGEAMWPFARLVDLAVCPSN